MLAAHTGRLPESYLVKKGTDFQVEETAFATGGFADIRAGRLAGKKVAVKAIRVRDDGDFPKIQKVGTIINVWVRLRQDVKLRIQLFCKECVLWMHISHPNVLELVAVEYNPETIGLSMISEFMENGNIINYIRTNEANRIRLVRPSHL